jgi:hypothetical protein
MDKKRSILAPFVAAAGLAAMLCSSAAIAAPQPQDSSAYRADRISTQGEITSITREGDQYRVVLNHGSYAYLVPVSMIRSRDIRVGDRVRIGGGVSGDLDVVTADYVAFAGEPAFTTDPMYRAVPFGSRGWMSGTVTNTNRRLNYITLRDDSTGLPVKIDVRNMDTKHSVNVWRTRPGDHISVNGAWENHDTFTAGRVQY